MDFCVTRSRGVLPFTSVTSGQEWVRDFIMDNDSHDHIPDGGNSNYFAYLNTFHCLRYFVL